MRMRKGFLAMGIAAALMGTLAMAPRAEAARVIIRPGFGFYYGPGPAYYYGPWAGPAYLYAPAPNSGQVKIDTPVKDAAIYVDGGYAGVTGHLKKFSLQPGNHQIEVRGVGGQTLFRSMVRVIAGQTTDVRF